uniref:ATP synthase subunit a n=1 Tax=Pholcus phalangioides TaxID=6932 RepID=L7NWI4_PHOPA|nr:ATP synthase F0 subunit 6 [Pholcus phalangioides]AFC77886.1 ATP synthase F0 subunit 6 [Pholcus phalangioides]
MMMSLFSVFDPVSYFGQVNWVVVLYFFIFFSNMFYLGGVGALFMGFMFSSVDRFFSVLGAPHGSVISTVMVFVFVYIMMENVVGLFPFVFTCTAHPLITLGLGLVGWLMCFLMGWFKNFMFSAAHLVPAGSPLGLSFLLVLIESISHLIRPLTLSIRLAANMMAGHLIIGLISSISKVSFISGVLSVFMQTVMLVLESGVAVVQGLVFSILLTLYTIEYY